MGMARIERAMGLNNDIDPWARITELEASNAEMRQEIQASHDVLDGAGADSDVGMKEISEGEQSLDQRLPARLIRYLLSMPCPYGKVKR